MGSAEKFCLRWNDFEANVSRSFAGIRESHHFFDVTLTTDDDDDRAEDLRAHKVILSACSEFFRNILVKESMSAHPNPLIYLRGISSQELRYVLDFMYHGEVNVAQDELDKFLEVAETLKIKGLTQNNESSSSPPSSTSRPRPKIEPPSPSPAAMKRPSAPSPAGGEPKKRPKIHSSSASASPAVTPSTSKMQHHAEEVEVTPTTVKTEGGTVGAVDESAFEGGTGDGEGEGDEDYGDYEGADYDEGEYEGEDGAIAGPSGAGDGGGAGGAGGATKGKEERPTRERERTISKTVLATLLKLINYFTLMSRPFFAYVLYILYLAWQAEMLMVLKSKAIVDLQLALPRLRVASVTGRWSCRTFKSCLEVPAVVVVGFRSVSWFGLAIVGLK
jgi:hypothetical protein